jgi:hypothetical protein
MSTREIAIYDETYPANGDLSAKQYFASAFTSTGTVGGSPSGDGIGIIQNKPEAANAAVQLRHHGISRHVVDGSGTAIAIGDPITSSSGKGIVATAGTQAYATALQPSSVDGDIIAVLMTGPFRIHA